MLTPKEVQELKSQLYEQIKDLPEPQKSEATKQIDNMSSEALESMLKQQQSKSKGQSNKGIFRLIADKEVSSRIIDENQDSLAVLDIKPISKGHIIIIPKKVISDVKQMPSSAFNLAKKIAKKISSKLKTKGEEIQTEFKFGEVIINIIPIYDKSLSINSPRTDPKDTELDDIYNLLRFIKKEKITKIKKQTTQTSQVIRINRRIP